VKRKLPKIRECDDQIAEKLDDIIGKDPEKQEHHIDKKTYKRINKNTPKDIDINLKSYQMFKGTEKNLKQLSTLPLG